MKVFHRKDKELSKYEHLIFHGTVRELSNVLVPGGHTQCQHRAQQVL